MRCLLRHPRVMSSLSFSSTTLFYRLALCLKERLSWFCSPGATIAPARLPSDVARFLASALNVSTALVNECWTIFGDIIWSTNITDEPDDLRSKELLDIFDKHGAPEGIYLHDLYPDQRTCLDPACAVTLSNGARQLRPLEKIIPMQCVRFTREFGPVNAVCYSAHCRKCNSRYYPAYYVHESGAVRTHYPGVPRVLHVQKHSFVDTSLCEHFTFEMVCAWVSGGNNAQIYNLEHRFVDPDDPRWHTSPLLTGSLVWNAFFTLALLREADEQGAPLVLPNAEDLDERLNGALRARNWRTAGTGQENWNHACSLCCQRFEEGGKKYYLRAVVTDGVTVGRPCCGVHDCQGQLPTLQHRFCLEHEKLEDQCCVVGCEADAEDDYMTCDIPEHRALEQDDEDEDEVEEEVEVDAGGDCTGKSEPKGPRARFGRRRTYCEQLCVATCGVALTPFSKL
ncbi:hypothetical protein PENSPDRAFT_596144 [Peniophora sp. CONT]|nr:hypothetical protein PENSPDRAFT_596144 [Peniophora sp. CONT]